MDVNDENNPATVKLRGLRGSGMEAGRKFVADRDRRALRDIRNFMGAHPFPSAVAKRGLSDKSSINDNNPHFGCHRPMTRQFSASLANKQHQDPNHKNQVLANMKETNAIPNSNTMDPNHRNEVLVNMKETKAIPNSNSVENFAFIDVDEYMEADDPLPSYVMQTEAILEEMEENCKIDEVQMVDLEVEPVLDIDSYDKNNPLAVVDYVEDIYAFYRKSESTSCVCPNYMYHQSDINEKMRAILIDWLIEVHYKFELMHETLFLTVNLIDRFLERQAVARRKLQLVGVTAMLLACKYEEVTVPVVEDLILISDKAYSKDEVLEMEKLMINTLQFNLSVPTPYVFMRRFLKAAESDKKLELLSFFIIELCLVEYEMVRFHPSMLAAAAIYTAQCTVNRFKHWSKTSERHTSYTENQLIECAQLMVGFHQKSAVGKLTGIHRKYCTSKFGFAAKSEPALFLFDNAFL